MKTRKFEKKLVLFKITVAHLDNFQMNTLKGGNTLAIPSVNVDVSSCRSCGKCPAERLY